MNDVIEFAYAPAVVFVPPNGQRTGRKGQWFFFAVSLAMLAIVLTGFSSTFYLKGIVVSRAPALPLEGYLILHGCVMTAWYLLFSVQTLFVAIGHKAHHPRLGVVGVVLAAAVVLTGGYVSLAFPAHLAELGVPNAEVFEQDLGTALANMVMLGWFSGFVTAAVLLRRRRAWHGRLMFWSFFITISPAFANGAGNGARLLGPLMETYLPGWPAVPILFAAAWIGLLIFDWRTQKHVLPATLVCPALLIAAVFTILGAVNAFRTPELLEFFLRVV